MNSIGHWRTDTRPFHSLVMVKSPPFRTLVNKVRINYQAAVIADKFSSFIIMNKSVALTLGALHCCFLELTDFFFFFFLSDTFFYFFPFGLLNYFYFFNFHNFFSFCHFTPFLYAK